VFFHLFFVSMIVAVHIFRNRKHFRLPVLYNASHL
jgi:hypothetical protein